MQNIDIKLVSFGAPRQVMPLAQLDQVIENILQDIKAGDRSAIFRLQDCRTRAEKLRWIQSYMKVSKIGWWAVRVGQKYVGHVILQNGAQGMPEIGCSILVDEFRNGYATKAIGLLVQQQAGNYPDGFIARARDTRSAGLLLKAGFQEVTARLGDESDTRYFVSAIRPKACNLEDEAARFCCAV